VRRPGLFLVGTLVVVLGWFGVTLALGNAPILGLDLQGGISVVLVPVDDADTDTLDVAVDIIRNRVDALGVAEPEITRQGGRIIVDLPGVRERDQAAALVGQTAELRFRPVVGCLPAEGDESATTTTTTAAAAEPPTDTTAPEEPTEVPTTPRSDDVVDQPVVLEGLEPCQPADESQGIPELPRYELGPTSGCVPDDLDQCVTGRAVDTARSEFATGQGYLVTVDFTGDGGTAFIERVATPNVNQRVAIVLDGIVQSAPVIQPDVVSGGGGSVQISGDFNESQASDLATVLRFGALPVELETETIQNVSPTLGNDQLRAGIAAGIIGLLLVAGYMLLYYRALALVAIAGLVLTGIWIYAVVAYLGDTIGLTLTLAGATGLIVSIGITVDSYVVYFERLKDEVRTGKTLRSSLQRGFQRSFRTILAGDVAALIGAGVLYWLAIGSVRGFAFFLGIATLLDLIITFFFMHPMTIFLTRSRRLMTARRIGVAAALDRPELEA